MSETLRTSNTSTQSKPHLIWIDMTISNKNHKQLGLTHRWWNMANSPFKKPYLFWVDAAGAGAGCGWWWWSFASWKSLRRVSWFLHTRPLILVWPCDAMLMFWKGIGNKYAKGSHITFVLDFGWGPFFYGFPILPQHSQVLHGYRFKLLMCHISLLCLPLKYACQVFKKWLNFPPRLSNQRIRLMQLQPMPRVDHSSPKARGGAVSSGRLEVPTGGLKMIVWCIALLCLLFCYWRFVHVFFSISIIWNE